MKSVAPDPQEILMYGTKRDAQLEPCILSSVQISPLLPRMTLTFFLLNSTAPQNLSLLSCVKFAMKSFQDFALYVNIKKTQHGFPIKTVYFYPDNIFNEFDVARLKKEFRSCHQLFVDSELERARHKVFTYAIEILNAKIMDERLDHSSNNLKRVQRK